MTWEIHDVAVAGSGAAGPSAAPVLHVGSVIARGVVVTAAGQGSAAAIAINLLSATWLRPGPGSG